MDFNTCDEGIDKKQRSIQLFFLSAKQFREAKRGFAN